MKYNIEVTRPKGLCENDYAYLAGIIDGEGTVLIYYNKYRNAYVLRFYVVNTNTDLIYWLKSRFGGYTYQRQDKKHTSWKIKYEWIAESKQADKIIQYVLPYLVIKRKQAELAFAFRQTISIGRAKISPEVLAKRKYFYEEIKRLNNA